MRDASKKLPWATAHRELGPRGRAADQAVWQPLLAQVPREPGATAGEPQPRSHSRGTAWLAWGAAWGRRVSNRIAVPPVHDMCKTVGSSSVNHRHAAVHTTQMRARGVDLCHEVWDRRWGGVAAPAVVVQALGPALMSLARAVSVPGPQRVERPHQSCQCHLRSDYRSTGPRSSSSSRRSLQGTSLVGCSDRALDGVEAVRGGSWSWQYPHI